MVINITVIPNVLQKAKEKLAKFLNVDFPLPPILRSSEPYRGYYMHGAIVIGSFENEEDEERVLIHELAHYVQDIYCKPKFPWFRAILEVIPLTFGLIKGSSSKLLQYLRFTEGFATWVEEEIMGERGESYWLSLPRYYKIVYYEGAKMFRNMGKAKAIKYALGDSEFCRRRR